MTPIESLDLITRVIDENVGHEDDCAMVKYLEERRKRAENPVRVEPGEDDCDCIRAEIDAAVAVLKEAIKV